jgi:hypothetical protein
MNRNGEKTMTKTLWCALAALALSGAVLAQTAAPAAKPAPALSAHVKEDITRHRAMAAAPEGAARCLESGKTEEVCQKELQAACKGLAIGKYCGMRHQH